jgi:hypothetical protein
MMHSNCNVSFLGLNFLLSGIFFAWFAQQKCSGYTIARFSYAFPTKTNPHNIFEWTSSPNMQKCTTVPVDHAKIKLLSIFVKNIKFKAFNNTPGIGLERS